MVRELHERVNRTDMDRSNTLVIGTEDTQVRETTMSHPARPDLSRRSSAIPPAHLPSGEGHLTWSSGRPCGSVRCPSPGRGAIAGVTIAVKSGHAGIGHHTCPRSTCQHACLRERGVSLGPREDPAETFDAPLPGAAQLTVYRTAGRADTRRSAAAARWRTHCTTQRCAATGRANPNGSRAPARAE